MPVRSDISWPRTGFLLLAYLELFDNRAVTVDILALQILKQRTALTDHSKQTAARMVVVLVHLQVLGELVDSLGEDRNLNFGRARVLFMNAVILDDRFFDFRFNHAFSPFCNIFRKNRRNSVKKAGELPFKRAFVFNLRTGLFYALVIISHFSTIVNTLSKKYTHNPVALQYILDSG